MSFPPGDNAVIPLYPTLTHLNGSELVPIYPFTLNLFTTTAAIAALGGGGGGAVTPVPVITSSAPEGDHVFETASATLYSIYCSAPSVDGYLLVVDANAAPSPGAVTPVLAPVPVFAGGGPYGQNFTTPAKFLIGVVAVFSTDTTNPYNYVAGGTAVFSAQSVLT